VDAPHRSLPPQTALGPVRLRVGDREAMAAFYRRAVGLHDLGAVDGVVRLGTLGGTALVELVGDPDAPARPGRTTGLFHLAVLLPSRSDLARAVHRVTDAGWGFTGAADHLVSEALYLEDPEGNGIEMYRDRPREEWEYRDGELAMATLPVDLDGVLAALEPGAPDEGVPDGTVMGHVHLQVRDIPEAGAFYGDVVGFDPVVRGYPGALFVSAGGYHHHLGLNTWGTRGAPAPPAGARGLDRYAVTLPSAADVDVVAGRLSDAGHEVVADAGGPAARDPSGNRMVLTTG
jgi:catechol 2,3-dioxygenase